MKNKKIITISIIVSLLIIIFIFFSLFNLNKQNKVRSILQNNNVGQIKYALKYDEVTKTLLVDGDLIDKYGRDDYDYDNVVKSLPQLFKENLVHQFEYSQKETVDKAGATHLNLKVLSSTGFQFNNEIFYSWKWNKNDVGICSRNIKIIPQFAHITNQSAKELEKMLNIKKCRLWNDSKEFKILWSNA